MSNASNTLACRLQRSSGDARSQGSKYTEAEGDSFNKHAEKEDRIFSKAPKHDHHTIPEVWS